MWPWSWTPKPSDTVLETTFSGFHDQTKHCDKDAMDFFISAIHTLKKKKNKINTHLITDITSKSIDLAQLKHCRDTNNNSLLYHAIQYSKKSIIRFLLEECSFALTQKDIELEIQLFLFCDLIKIDLHSDILKLLITKYNSYIDLVYIIDLIDARIKDGLIIQNMINYSNFISTFIIIIKILFENKKINEEKKDITDVQRSIILICILFNNITVFEHSIFDLIIRKFDINLNLEYSCHGYIILALHAVVTKYFSDFDYYRDSPKLLTTHKKEYFDKIKILIDHGADINLKNSKKETIFDLIKRSKLTVEEQYNFETEITDLYIKYNKYNKYNANMISQHRNLPSNVEHIIMSFSNKFTPEMLFGFLKTIKDKNLKDLPDEEKGTLLLYKEYYNKNTDNIQEELNKKSKTEIEQLILLIDKFNLIDDIIQSPP